MMCQENMQTMIQNGEFGTSGTNPIFYSGTIKGQHWLHGTMDGGTMNEGIWNENKTSFTTYYNLKTLHLIIL